MRSTPRASASLQQLALEREQPAVDAVHLIDERLDAVVVEPEALHEIDGLVAQLVEAALLARRKLIGAERGLDLRVLQLAEPLIERCDLIERGEHLGLQRGFHRRERQIALVVEVVVHAGNAFAALAFRLLAAFAVAFRRACGFRRLRLWLRRRRHWGNGRRCDHGLRSGRGRHYRRCTRRTVRSGCGRTGRWRLTGHDHTGNRRSAGYAAGLIGAGDTAIHRFEIDDVAQQRLAFVQLVAPDGERLEGQGTLAQRADHQFAAGLDAFCDGDLAFARQQLDRSHLAQIHAHGIVGAVVSLFGLLADLGDLAAGGNGGNLGAFAFFLLFALDDVDAHLVEHRHRVFDLLGRHFVGGKNAIELVIRHVTALLGARDHLAHRRIGQIEQGRVGFFFRWGSRLRRIRAGGAVLLRLGIDLAGDFERLFAEHSSHRLGF